MTSEARDDDMAAFEAALGYRFRQKRLLKEALTHGSYRNESPGIDGDNERLEFLGDAVLDLMVGTWLFEGLPSSGEGALTANKAALVCEASLAQLAKQLGLEKHLRLGRGEEKSGGRNKASLMANALEAVIAAIYLDSSFREASGVVRLWYKNAGKEGLFETERGEDPRSKLQRIVQSEFGCLPVYETEPQQGPDHDAVFLARVEVPRYTATTGTAKSKKAAMRMAAAEMLRQIEGSS